MWVSRCERKVGTRHSGNSEASEPKVLGSNLFSTR